MTDLRNVFLELLFNEVKPALGCTEPVAVALATAKTKEILGEEIVSCSVIVSSSIYKNGMCVGIPSTKRIGLTIAACLGICGGDASQGLQVLNSLDEKTVELAEKMMDKKIVKINYLDTPEKVFVEVKMQGRKNKCLLRIMQKHDNFVFISRNDEVILDKNIDVNKILIKADNIFDLITVKSLVEIVKTYTEEELDFLWEGLEMNKAAALQGIESTTGSRIGNSFQQAFETGELSNDVLTRAMLWTAAASDVRMSGENISIMSSNGSGNHGITAIVPIAAYADMVPCERIDVLKAMAMSHLMTAYIKSYTGRLSAVCGCGVAAATGASLGLSYLMGMSVDQMENTVDIMIAGISGMVCDGAKAGCAIKLALAASSAVSSCYMSKYNAFLPKFNGIVGTNVEESIHNLGLVCSEGMMDTDRVILEVMNSMDEERNN